MAHAMAPEEFKARARAARTARQIVDLVRSRVLPAVRGPDLEPYRRILMSCARRFNEDLGDAASAVALWTEAYRCAGGDDDRQTVVAIMMSVASKRAHAALPREQRDVDGAIAIYEAVLRLGHSADQDLRVIRTMMAVANRFTDLDLPASELDVDAAVAIWRAVHRLGPAEGDGPRVVRTMMDVANRLTDLRGGGRTRDLDAAIRIWRAVHGLAADDESRLWTVRTMMAQARRLSDVDDPEGVRDVGQAVRLWLAARELGGRDDPDESLHVVRTMMDAANRLTDLAGPAERRDVDAAVTIWSGVAAAGAEEDRQRAVLTMMAVAGRLADLPSGPDDAISALKLWYAAWRVGADEVRRLRVIKTVMDIAQRRDRLCAEAAAALDRDAARAFDPGFRLPVQAGLRYYLGDFDAVIALADGAGAALEAVAALGADARRKLRRYGDAEDRCTALIRASAADHREASLSRRDALVSALCCRGYCFLERGRTDGALLDRAAEDFHGAVAAAESAGLAVPPRAHTGLAFVLRLQGREAEAEAALARAREEDRDNPKALAEARDAEPAANACPLCPPLERTPVAANDLAFALRDAAPVSSGHTLVITRRHVADWWSATPEERAALLALVDEVKAALDAECDPAGYTVGFDTGAVAGQAVPHLHLHVIPRFAGQAGHPAGGGGLRRSVPAGEDRG
jgi:diadenosine tetraphosphate (Ap4A) HIT family hydrolase